jgi:hypothetical protein
LEADFIIPDFPAIELLDYYVFLAGVGILTGKEDGSAAIDAITAGLDLTAGLTGLTGILDFFVTLFTAFLDALSFPWILLDLLAVSRMALPLTILFFLVDYKNYLPSLRVCSMVLERASFLGDLICFLAIDQCFSLWFYYSWFWIQYWFNWNSYGF